MEYIINKELNLRYEKFIKPTLTEEEIKLIEELAKEIEKILNRKILNEETAPQGN